jgi:hypothetical protein
MRVPARDAAWAFVEGEAQDGVVDDKLINAAKAAPVLMMASGLFQGTAYLHQEGGAQGRLAEGLAQYLLGDGATFESLALALRSGQGDLMGQTDQALDWLEWVKLLTSALG